VNVLITESDGDRLLAIWEIREAKRRSSVIFAATAVIAGTSTTSPKVITFSSPTNIKIQVGLVISGGSFAGTEVVSVVTTNGSGLITAVTYTGTGAINASPANFTFTGYRIEVDDETQVINEYGKTAMTKTRSEVSGTTPVEKDKGVFYYARRMVDLTAKPVLGKIENGYQTATFTMKDVGIKI
jgi:hypothetical protein